MKRPLALLLAVLLLGAVHVAPAHAAGPNVIRPLPPGTTALCADGSASTDWQPASACAAAGGVAHWLVSPVSTPSGPVAIATLDTSAPHGLTAGALPPGATVSGQGPAAGDSSGVASSTGVSPAGPDARGEDGHTYYASTASNASTIYCDDDPDWQRLSPRNLVSFSSLAAAMTALPGYHLHRPC